MNPGSPPPSDAIFLVKCADYKCLAVRNGNGKWKSFYDDAELPNDVEAIVSVPLELVLPFLPDFKRARLCPVRLPVQR
jgi:hypothetical protein